MVTSIWEDTDCQIEIRSVPGITDIIMRAFLCPYLVFAHVPTEIDTGGAEKTLQVFDAPVGTGSVQESILNGHEVKAIAHLEWHKYIMCWELDKKIKVQGMLSLYPKKTKLILED